MQTSQIELIDFLIILRGKHISKPFDRQEKVPNENLQEKKKRYKIHYYNCATQFSQLENSTRSFCLHVINLKFITMTCWGAGTLIFIDRGHSVFIQILR